MTTAGMTIGAHSTDSGTSTFKFLTREETLHECGASHLHVRLSMFGMFWGASAFHGDVS